MKKFLGIVLTLTMATGLLAGCGSTETTGSSNTGSAGSTGETQLSGSVSTDGSTSMEEVIGALGEQFLADTRRDRHLQPHRFRRRH